MSTPLPLTLEPTTAQELAWAKRHMPLLQRALEALPGLSGMRLACSMHLDLKIVPLVEGLLSRGAQLFLVTCNPTTVRDEVVAYVRGQGIQAQAWYGMSPAAFQEAVQAALNWGPTHLCELGADLTAALHAPGGERPPVMAGLEGTGSGIARLEGLELRYPIFNWDDLPVKEGLHNRHMVGMTTWHTFFARTHLTLHGKQVAVIGYGPVGQGVAATARAFGGVVTIVERDTVRLLQAVYDGWQVQPLETAIRQADVIVTATGAQGVLTSAHFSELKAGVFLLNVGHQAGEIDAGGLYAHPHQQVMPFIDEIRIAGKPVYLLAGGSMANLTAGYGDSLNAFDVTLAVLAAGIGFIARDGARQPAGIYLLPRPVWEPVIL